MDQTSIPEDIEQSIAAANAAAIGLQPAVLANLALANQVFQLNLAQQNAVQQQQAMFQVRLAIVGRLADLILTGDLSSPDLGQKLDALERLMQISTSPLTESAADFSAIQSLVADLKARTEAQSQQ